MDVFEILTQGMELYLSFWKYDLFLDQVSKSKVMLPKIKFDDEGEFFWYHLFTFEIWHVCN